MHNGGSTSVQLMNHQGGPMTRHMETKTYVLCLIHFHRDTKKCIILGIVITKEVRTRQLFQVYWPIRLPLPLTLLNLNS